MTDNGIDRTASENAMSQNVDAFDGRVGNYLKWNLEIFPINRGKRILDMGCGPGLYFESIMEYTPAVFLGVDQSEHYVKQMKQRTARVPHCTVAQVDILDRDQTKKLFDFTFDYTLFFDVLEHIEDDEKALLNLHDLIKNTGSGLLFLRVPALQCIFGENDRSIGHYRRYSRKSLETLLKRCSFTVKSIRYQNIAGIFLWYFIGRILKRSTAVDQGESKFINAFVPLLRALERLIPPPVGLSLCCVCTVDADDNRSVTS